MEIVADLGAAVIIAFILTLIFAGLKQRGPWGSLWTFFLIVLLATWAIGALFNPIGPSVWGIYFLPFLIVGVFVAVLLAAVTQAEPFKDRPREVRGAMDDDEARKVSVGASIGMLFWLLVVFLVILLITQYVGENWA